MTDTSTEAVEQLAAICTFNPSAHTFCLAGMTLRALLAERNRMQKALETIRDMVVDGVSFNTIARAALGEDRA